MTRAATFITAAFLCGTAAAQSSPVTFLSPRECRDNHCRGRWTVKIMRRLHKIRADSDNKR